MKAFKDGMGVVFDIRAENFEAFMDNFARLKETGDRIDFDVAKCADLSAGGRQHEEGPRVTR